MLSHRRRNTYPPLSQTYASHQLWTPLKLERITINEQKYHEYLKSSISQNPSHLNAISRRVKKYGDNNFYVHKDIPVQQCYECTSLKRSNTRPWDQIMSRPLMSGTVLSMESNLPFPSEHPFTSHISQFALFPKTTNDNTTESMHNLKEAGVQTDNIQPNMLNSHLICAKAFSNGIRIETVARQPFVTSNLQTPGIYRWDISRAHSKRQQCCCTYPAPSTMFSSKYDCSISSNTAETLKSVNKSTATSTTYKTEFSPFFLSSSCQEPKQCFDSRGKYAHAPDFSLKESLKDVESNVTMVDQSTQTSFVWNVEEDNISTCLSRDYSYLTDESSIEEMSVSHDCIPLYSKTELLKQFYQTYPDTVPALQTNSFGMSRRHIINGYHAYYWH